jgi:UDP-glucose 4-epimerase
MLEGRQPQIFGTGDQERDFIYVGDVVDANILAIDEGDNDSFNIGTGRGVSVNRVFELLQNIIQYKRDAIRRSPRQGEVYKISLECSKARQRLKWSPKVSLEEGLQQTVEFFRKAVRATA